MFIAAVLVIVTRNVPSFFNESKLIAICIYNLGFLAAVCIPVIIGLEEEGGAGEGRPPERRGGVAGGVGRRGRSQEEEALREA